MNNRQSKERKGRKRTRNPDKWHSRHVKKCGLRINAPCEITSCCKKNCLQSFSVENLQKLKNDFLQLYYDQQNIYLCGLLHRFKTKRQVVTGVNLIHPPPLMESDEDAHVQKIVPFPSSIMLLIRKE